MTKAMGLVFDHLVGTLDARKVCEGCRDKTRCSDCVFNIKQQIHNSPLRSIQSDTFSKESQNAKVLIKISGGIIDRVEFYNRASDAIRALSAYVRTMYPERDEAAVFGINGFIANAKDFLDEDENYFDNLKSVLKRLKPDDESIYIIGNPHHHLGFMVASSDDPLGYKEPASAISDLGQMRQDHGDHLKLYRVIPETEPVVTKADLEQYNSDCDVEDFDNALVKEYLR
jgi:hypothetical protein